MTARALPTLPGIIHLSLSCIMRWDTLPVIQGLWQIVGQLAGSLFLELPLITKATAEVPAIVPDVHGKSGRTACSPDYLLSLIKGAGKFLGSLGFEYGPRRS